VPLPFIFYKYGAQIRQRCTYAAEADAFMRRLAEKNQAEVRKETEETNEEKDADQTGHSSQVVDETNDTESLSTVPSRVSFGRHASRASRQSGRSIQRVATATQYEENPYDLDLVNTRQSAISTTRKE
jgi:hypothetical protein